MAKRVSRGRKKCFCGKSMFPDEYGVYECHSCGNIYDPEHSSRVNINPEGATLTRIVREIDFGDSLALDFPID